jgi:hypothetical protein
VRRSIVREPGRDKNDPPGLGSGQEDDDDDVQLIEDAVDFAADSSC